MWITRVRAAAVFIVIWTTGLGAGRAYATDAESEADKLIRHGIELRRALDDEAAAREFQRAYKLEPTPRAAAQLGLAKQALGLWEEAEPYVAEALRAAGQDTWATKNRAVLDEALGTIHRHLGRVEVIGDPEGAEVSVNGRRVGKLPLAQPVRVSAGQVDIEIRAPDYLSAQRTVTLVGGQYQRVVIHLTRVEATKADLPKAERATLETDKASVAPQQDQQVPIGPAATATGSSDVERGAPSRARTALKWTAAGLAVGGLAVGVLGTSLHSSNVTRFDEHPCRNKGGSGVLIDGTPDATCQSLLDTFRTDQKVAIIGFAAAGAFAATWLFLFLTEPSPAGGPTANASLRTFCTPSLSDLGFACTSRF